MRLIQLSVFLSIIVLFWSCEENQELPETKNITIDEVRNFVNDKRHQNGRLEQGMEILYELGVYQETSLGEAIAFPVDPIKALYVSGSDSTKRFSVASTAFTFAYKEEGQLYVDLIQPVPTTNQAHFTGYVLVSQFGGEVKRVLYYEEGVYIGEKNSGLSNGRGEGVDCETTHYYGCWDVSVGGDSYGGDCEYEGSATTCHVNNGDNTGGFQPEDVIDAGPDGGGGEGGASPSELNNCVHPFNPDLRVPCNENTCGEGYVPDGNGGCVEDIVNLLENPCLKTVANKLIYNDLKNKLNTAIQDIFHENNQTVNLVLDEDLFLDKLARTSYDNRLGAVEVKISLNPNYLRRASQEYMASIFYHELVHAYLNATGFDPLPLNQHIEMGENYVDWMIAALQEVFPHMTDRQASSLSFRGLAAFRNAYPDYFDELIAAYGFTSVQDLTEETDSLRDGTSGTDCN